MFHATSGVNTHKGLIFSAAVLSRHGKTAGAAMRGRRKQRTICPVRSSGTMRFERLFRRRRGYKRLTLYRQYRITGVRGEAAGFPSAFHIGYPARRLWLDRGVSLNDAAALVHLLAAVEDTNLIHRGGYSAAAACRVEAQQMIGELTPESLHRELERMDERYTQGNLSPGGCADLLALSIFLLALNYAGYLHAEKRE